MKKSPYTDFASQPTFFSCFYYSLENLYLTKRYIHTVIIATHSFRRIATIPRPNIVGMITLTIINSTTLFQAKMLETIALVTIALGLLAGYRLIHSREVFKRMSNERLVKAIPFELIYAMMSFVVGIVATLILILLFK